ncbi:LysR substrate-binding domain-containing protein [Ochrobactrum sp. BD67]
MPLSTAFHPRWWVEAFTSGQADLGFADGPLDRPAFNIETRPIPAVVGVPQGHRLADYPEISPVDLADERMTTPEPGSLFAMRVEVALAGILRSTTIETRLLQRIFADAAWRSGLLRALSIMAFWSSAGVTTLTTLWLNVL